MIEVLTVKYYTVSELSEILKLHKVTIRNYIVKEIIKAQKIGKNYYISEIDLKNYIESGNNKKV